MSETPRQDLGKAIRYLSRSRKGKKARVAVILGSGFAKFVEGLRDAKSIPYSQIPGFLSPSVKGHTGRLWFGSFSGEPIICLQGRVHFYEGFGALPITFPVRVLKGLGVETLVVSAAVGSTKRTYKPGSLVIVEDHLNFQGANPLIGFDGEEPGPFFPDLTDAYDPELRRLAEEAAKAEKIPVGKGIHAAFSGPSFETPAEVRFAESAGAATVGMSLVPEVIMARRIGVRILGILCVANYASGVAKQAGLTHEDVLSMIESSGKDFSRLLARLMPQITQETEIA